VQSPLFKNAHNERFGNFEKCAEFREEGDFKSHLVAPGNPTLCDR